MPNFNPFGNDHEDTSFETGAPVSQAAKNLSQAAQKQADDAAVKAAQDFDQTTGDIVAQLYGVDQSSDPGTDETNPQMTDHTAAAAHMAKAQSTGGTHASQSANGNSNQTPEEQAKMEKIRRELFGNYSSKFQSAPNGAQNINTNLDMEMEKARQERKRKEEERKREEEEEAQRKKEEEEAQKQELVMPSGKKAGFQMGKPKQQPMALRQAQTKTEIQRGTTG